MSIFECAKSVYWLNVIRGYYHFSSHKRDDFLVRNPGFDRVNYVRDMLILGYAWYWTNNLRLYGDAGWIYTDVADDHTHLREESNYSGNFVVQAGRA